MVNFTWKKKCPKRMLLYAGDDSSPAVAFPSSRFASSARHARETCHRKSSFDLQGRKPRTHTTNTLQISSSFLLRSRTWFYQGQKKIIFSFKYRWTAKTQEDCISIFETLKNVETVASLRVKSSRAVTYVILLKNLPQKIHFIKVLQKIV